MIETLNILGFRAIYGFTVLHPSLALLGIFFATALPYLLIALLIYYEGLKRRFSNGRIMLVRLAVAPAIALIVTTFMKHQIALPRPYAVFSDVVPLAHYTDALATFPSMHTMIFAALGTILYCHDHAMGKWFLAGAGAIGLGRVMVGVHWPLDVIIGWMFGIAIGYACFLLERRYANEINFLKLR